MLEKCHKITLLLLIFSLGMFVPGMAGTTGKITGAVTDEATGEALPGVNVYISETSLGVATDINGYFTILSVPPGTYSVVASVVGYRKVTVNDVRVYIDQTTRLDFKLILEAIESDVIMVVAERKPVQIDVSTSTTALSDRELEVLPINNVTGVVGLQAGIQGLNIRGGMAADALVMVDGVVLRDPRNNEPIASVPLSAVKEISIERGGFNAEYGQVQSGLVNIVTKEGTKDHYQVSAQFRYNSPQKKYFGISPFDRNSVYMRSFLDDQVCWTGTEAGWDEYTQKQFPYFQGWNKVSQDLMTDKDPSNDLSPVGAQRVWMWEHRKRPVTDQGDYDIDLGLGGPLPFVSKPLGNLRFYTSYRQHREMLLVPLNRPDYLDYDYQLQLISDLSPTMKLKFVSLLGKQYTQNQNWTYGYFLRNPSDIAGDISDRDIQLFSSGYYSDADINYKSFALKLYHTLSARTYYEVSVEHLIRNYDIHHPAFYNTARQHEIVPGYFVDNAPLGFSVNDISPITGTLFGGHSARIKDFSQVSATTFKSDLTSQVTFNHLLKGGAEFVYNDLDLNYGIRSGAEDWNLHVQRLDKPIRAALYLQDKLEEQGFIVNLGLRYDYSDANTQWYDLSPYDKSFFSNKFRQSVDYATVKTKSQSQLSPRLGISHPITENSKLYFNYGHFKQMPSYEQMFRIQRDPTGKLTDYGDPSLVLEKTIAYELGYDHSLGDMYLIQLAAFYKDISNQAVTVQYISKGGEVSYNKITDNGYADIRGFELTLNKAQGTWFRGFANYTYQVTTSGRFDRGIYYENPGQQVQYDQITSNLYQDHPRPRPYARLNLTFLTPVNYGFKIYDIHPLGDLALNILGNWQRGDKLTYNPLDPKITYNVQWIDYHNFQIRFTKTVTVKKMNFTFFMDVYNLTNHTYFSNVAFYNYQDYLDYIGSLHLPKSTAYDNIEGHDKYGEVRSKGAEFQPMSARGPIDFNNPNATGKEGVVYWVRDWGKYYEYINDPNLPVYQRWKIVDQDRIDKINKDKAYIDMPNKTSFTFLNPRQIFYGLRVTFNF